MCVHVCIHIGISISVFKCQLAFKCEFVTINLLTRPLSCTTNFKYKWLITAIKHKNKTLKHCRRVWPFVVKALHVRFPLVQISPMLWMVQTLLQCDIVFDADRSLIILQFFSSLKIFSPSTNAFWIPIFFPFSENPFTKMCLVGHQDRCVSNRNHRNPLH